MRIPASIALAALLLPAVAARASVLYDFDSQGSGSGLPAAITVDGLTATISCQTGLNQGYYFGSPAAYIYVNPPGFSGMALCPSGIVASDLTIDFSQPLSDFSILYAPDELATDSSCTMRLTVSMDSTFVATTTYSNPNPGTYPSDTLAISSPQPFNHVVVHYDKPPVTGGDYGTIFYADNMQVTVSTVPEPASLAVLLAGGGLASLRRRRR